MFTKQHYKAIAEILKNRFVDLADNVPGIAVGENIKIIGNELADYFEKDNERFNRNKFLAACGISS